MPYLTAVVEGSTDEPVVRKLAALHNLDLIAVYVMGGKDRLDQRIGAYNNAARFSPWLVLRDYDDDNECPGATVASLLPHSATNMRFRLAVRAMEAWLREDFVPKTGSRMSVGIGYSARVIEFGLEHWSPRRAAHRAPSLRKCINSLATLYT